MSKHPLAQTQIHLISFVTIDLYLTIPLRSTHTNLLDTYIFVYCSWPYHSWIPTSSWKCRSLWRQIKGHFIIRHEVKGTEESRGKRVSWGFKTCLLVPLKQIKAWSFLARFRCAAFVRVYIDLLVLLLRIVDQTSLLLVSERWEITVPTSKQTHKAPLPKPSVLF